MSPEYKEIKDWNCSDYIKVYKAIRNNNQTIRTALTNILYVLCIKFRLVIPCFNKDGSVRINVNNPFARGLR